MKLAKYRVVVVRQRDIPFEIWFQSEEDPFLPELMLDKEVWYAMGYPDVVTVTVEPGEVCNCRMAQASDCGRCGGSGWMREETAWRCRNPDAMLAGACSSKTGGKPGTLHRDCGWDED